MSRARDPRAVLRALRALPLVAATEGDKDINGGDAVEELARVREIIDEALGEMAEGQDDA